MVNDLGLQNSLVGQYLSELRDESIQQDRMRFRRNLERLGEIFAYEISKTLAYDQVEVTTSLGMATANVIKEQPVLATILRAGLPLHNGLLSYFDKADNAFISAYRKHHKDGSFDVHVEYMSSPSLTDRILILSDPMLATGTSMVLTHKALATMGKPRHTHIVAAVASAEGIDYLKKHMSSNVTLWVAAIDEELTAQSYIVPGLGDAGDLAFGGKE